MLLLVVPVLPATIASDGSAPTPVPPVTTDLNISVIRRHELVSYTLTSLPDVSTIVLPDVLVIFVTHVGCRNIPSFAIVAYAPAISSVETPYVKPPSATALVFLSIHTLWNPILSRKPIPILGVMSSLYIFHATVFFDFMTAVLSVICPAYEPSALLGPPSILSSVTIVSGVFPCCKYGV